MSKLVLITGLQRGSYYHWDATTASGIYPISHEGPASVQGFRVKSALGRQYSFTPGGATAGAAAATATFSGSTSNINFQANYPGTYGNNISIILTQSGTGTQTGLFNVQFTTTWSTPNGYPTFTINVPSAGLQNWQIVNAINADEQLSQFITASTLSPNSTDVQFGAIQLTGGTNPTTTDAEPPYGLAGEPIWINVTDKVTVVVDIQDRVVQRTLQRNRWRYISLGAIEGVNIT